MTAEKVTHVGAAIRMLLNQIGVWLTFVYATRSYALAVLYTIGTMVCGIIVTVSTVTTLNVRREAALNAGVYTSVVCNFAGFTLATHRLTLALALVIVHSITMFTLKQTITLVDGQL